MFEILYWTLPGIPSEILPTPDNSAWISLSKYNSLSCSIKPKVSWTEYPSAG